MKMFAAILAFAFAIPLSLIVVGGAHLYYFWRTSSPSTGRVSAVQARDWIDDEAYPVTRYFASVQYVVAGAEHTIAEWGPHVEPLAVGRAVAVRYRTANPPDAKVWSAFEEHHPLWLVVPVAICIAVEVWALRAWLG